jgi:glycosyltransferase involved in cell wall biosynthesis
MKVLLLNYSNSGGGAATAAFRLFSALREYGVAVDFGVVDKMSTDPSIISLRIKSIYFFFKKAISYSEKALGLKFDTSNAILHSENKRTLIDIDYINSSDYDLIHLHWINNDMISIEDIKKIKKPIVWTMHDSWVFCGAEHHPNIMENDNRFITGYAHANKPKTTKGPDICKKTWLRKRKSWRNCQFNFIAPSNFEKDSLRKSALFYSTQCVTVIPNLIPDVFRPLKNENKHSLKEVYCIPPEKKIIGFGAAFSDKNKGKALLMDALKKIKNVDKFYLILFGQENVSFSDTIHIPIFAAGNINSHYILSGIYNLCDVFVCPSIAENLPNVCLESLFCGIPIAAFRTGGIPDIVEHKKTGYLADPFSTDDLYQGILYCIDNHAELSDNSLRKAKEDFNAGTIVQKHIELYKKVLISQKKFSS